MHRLCLFFFLLCLPVWSQTNATVKARNVLADIPLSFEENQGQAAGLAKYMSRGPGYTIYLTSTEVVVAGSAGKLRMKLVGSNRHARIEPLDQSPGISNYFIGSDQSKWRSGIPHFARVAIRDAYPGIDLVFYGNERQLEYDAIVSPGADPRRIRVKLSPAKNLNRDENGDVVVKAGAAELRLRKPGVYQVVEGKKRSVEGGYALGGNGELAFTVGEYDSGKPLVIDPVVIYSTYIGGNLDDYCAAVAADVNGNIYVAAFTGTWLFGSGISPDGPLTNVLVEKLNPQGQRFYVTYFADFHTAVSAIAVDTDGNAYVTGTTDGNGIRATSAFQPTFGGGPAGQAYDAFVVKLGPSGTVAYSSYLGGSGTDRGTGIAVDSNHNVYVTGSTTGSFPVANAFQGTFGGGGTDAFVTKINPQGAVIYSTYLGGSGYDTGTGIAADSNGNAYVVGTTGGQGFPLSNALQPTFGGGNDVFVTKISPQGDSLVYSTYLGGPDDDHSAGMALDGDGNVYVTGNTNGFEFPMVHAVQPTSSGDIEAFVAKINAQGSGLVYSTYLGGIGFDQGIAITADSVGNAYVTGSSEIGLPQVNALPSTLGPGRFHAFVTAISAAGDALLSSTYLGGDGSSFLSGSIGYG
ncbi:MAG TPA: SBBP repeat-containing protein, partial [Bryobacteraceae bacterium]|nr:SBBP repeat-containing protein [Bryobacteraceae bacterium]